MKTTNFSKDLNPLQFDMVHYASSVNIIVNHLSRINQSKGAGILSEVQVDTLDQELDTDAMSRKANLTFKSLRQMIRTSPTDAATLICALIERIEEQQG